MACFKFINQRGNSQKCHAETGAHQQEAPKRQLLRNKNHAPSDKPDAYWHVDEKQGDDEVDEKSLHPAILTQPRENSSPDLREPHDERSGLECQPRG